MKLNLKPITTLIFHRTGIDISKYDEGFLKRILKKRMQEVKCSSSEEYILLLEHDAELNWFLASLQISYSEFFRNPLTFEVISQLILPAIAQRKKQTKQKEIRIWSAACASGQETYSLAILLEEFRNNCGEKINFRIFASDQNEVQIEEAKKGIYTDLSLGNVSMKRMKNWFLKNGNSYEVKPELKENIDFLVFDLFNKECLCPSESIFGDFDLVMCANVLFYFKPVYRQKILRKVTHCLTKGGYIATGESEREILTVNSLKEVYPQSAVFGIV